jgi:hypothetical protein
VHEAQLLSAWQGDSFGTLLVATAVREMWLRGARRIEAYVFAHKTPSVRFWRDHLEWRVRDLESEYERTAVPSVLALQLVLDAACTWVGALLLDAAGTWPPARLDAAAPTSADSALKGTLVRAACAGLYNGSVTEDKMLGQGGFCAVYAATLVVTTSTTECHTLHLASKSPLVRSKTAQARLQAEAAVLAMLNARGVANVVGFVDFDIGCFHPR